MTHPPLRRPRLSILHVIRRAVMKLVHIQVWDQAASMTFFLSLSLVPLVVSLVSIVSVAGVEHSVLRGIAQVVHGLFPTADPRSIARALAALPPSGGSVVGIVLGSLGTLIAASNAVAAFHRAMHRIYETREGRQFLPFRAIVLVETVALLAGLALAAMAIALGGELAVRLGDLMGLDRSVALLWNVLRWPLLLLILVVYVNVAYYLGPNARLPRLGLLSAGSMVAVAGLFALAVLLGWLSSLELPPNRLLTTLNGALIVLLVGWVACLVLIAGAALDAELLRARQLAVGIRAWDELALRPRNRWTLDFLAEDRRTAERMGRCVAESVRAEQAAERGEAAAEARHAPERASAWMVEADSRFAVTGRPEIREKLLEAVDPDRAQDDTGSGHG